MSKNYNSGNSDNNVINIICIVFVYSIFFGVLLLLKGVLYSIVIPSENMFVEDWVNYCFQISVVLLAVSIVITLLRYVLEQWFLKEKHKSQRLRWVLNFLFHIILTIGVIVYSNANYPVKEGNLIVVISYIILGILPFYFATALFSPSSVKYAAPFSISIRRW